MLGQNFRSRAAVLDACNYLFAAVMGETVGDLAYTDKEALHLGADYYPEAGNERYKTEACSWTRTDSARTMMRRIRPNSKHGLPRSGFVRCSTKGFPVTG